MTPARVDPKAYADASCSFRRRTTDAPTPNDVERNDDGNDAIVENRSREPPRRVTSAVDVVSEPSETREVFVDLEDTPDRLGAPANASAAGKLLVAAAGKLRALADAHRLKLDAARPFPERHLRTETSCPRLNTRTIRPPVSR